MKDFVKELALLADLRRSELSFSVKMTAMICDSPQRVECKGIKSFSGFYSCERCEVKGEKVNNTTCFANLDEPARTDEKWDSYEASANEPSDDGDDEQPSTRDVSRLA